MFKLILIEMRHAKRCFCTEQLTYAQIFIYQLVVYLQHSACLGVRFDWVGGGMKRRRRGVHVYRTLHCCHSEAV